MSLRIIVDEFVRLITYEHTAYALCFLYCYITDSHGRIYNFSLGGPQFFLPARCRHNMAYCTVKCLVSVSDCVIYILPLLWSYKYDAVVVTCCDKQHFYVLIFWLVAHWRGVPPRLPKYAHAESLTSKRNAPRRRQWCVLTL